MFLASGIWRLRLRMQRRRKDKADTYNLEILQMIERLDKVSDLGGLDKVREQLFDIMRRVVEDVQQNTVSSESFHLFAFPWEVAISALRHREIMVMRSDVESQAPKEPATDV